MIGLMKDTEDHRIQLVNSGIYQIGTKGEPSSLIRSQEIFDRVMSNINRTTVSPSPQWQKINLILTLKHDSDRIQRMELSATQ